MNTSLARHQRTAPYDFDGELAAYARLFGPATCGCVAQAQMRWSYLSYALQQKSGGVCRGWVACPICKGEGIDPRIARPLDAAEALSTAIPSFIPIGLAVGPALVDAIRASQPTGIEDTEIPAHLIPAVLAAAEDADGR